MASLMHVLSNRLRSFLLVAALGLGAVSAPAFAEAPARAPKDPAALAVERCRSSSVAKARPCYTAVLDERLAGGGPEAAVRMLDGLAALDPDVRRDGHMYAHRIGIMALKSPAEVGRVFATCTPAYQSGCYHGVIQAYFIALEHAGAAVTTESLEAVCADHRGNRRDLLFQCTHGLGHGLAILRRHELPEALGGCDLLSREMEREMCYAGAFMETLVNTTHPDHVDVPDHGSAGHAPEAGPMEHDHHGEASAGANPAKPPFPALDPNDLQYPCSVLADKYLNACYLLQTSAMLHHTKGDVGRTAQECTRAPEKYRSTCFLSLGRDVRTLSGGKFEEAVRMCGLAPAGFRPMCHRGVVETTINMNSDPAEGIPYCKAVTEADSKRACYVAVGLQALVFPDGEARREQTCRLAEPDQLETCLGRPPSAPAPAAKP